MGGLKSASWSI